MFGEADRASWNWAPPAPVTPCPGRWGQGMQLAHQSLKPVELILSPQQTALSVTAESTALLGTRNRGCLGDHEFQGLP